MNKNLIKWTLLWLGVVWVLFTSTTNAYAEVTPRMDGDIPVLTVCGTEYISDSEWAEWCITIMDRNLWASTTWAWPSASEESYWNYYQWWDNTPHTEEDWNGSNIQPNNAWWWESDNNELVYPVKNASERRWPCPENYHVPSQWEWSALMDIWFEATTNWTFLSNIVSQFYTAFFVPYAGFRVSSDGGDFWRQGSYSMYWSSSPYGGSAWYFSLENDGGSVYSYTTRSDGWSVRCFRDSALGSSSSEGGEPQVIVNIADFNSWQNTCSGSNFLFENIVAWTSTGTYTRSWVFECAFGNGKSNPTVTLQLSWNLVASWDRVISWSNLEMKNTEWSVTPWWLKFAQTLIDTWHALTETQILFKKSTDLIWVASWVVTIQLTVPWWTPDGTYNWTLVLTY